MSPRMAPGRRDAAQPQGVTFTGTRDIPIADLTRFPGNARRGNTDEIRASIRRHGQYRAIVVRDCPDGLVILAGNHTRDALEAEGFEAARCEVITCTDDEARRINLADNRLAELGTYDDEALAGLLAYLDEDYEGTGWSAEDVEGLLREEPEPRTDPDDVPDLPSGPPVTQPGDIWQLGPHRLLCGDAASASDHERLLSGGVPLPLALTSFPYGVGLDYGETYKDDLGSLRRLLADVPPLVHAALDDGGYFVTNFGDIVSAMGALGTDEPCEYPAAVDYWPAFRDAGYMLQTRRIWAKPHARVAAPWTASSNRAASDWEHIWTWKKPGRGLNERRDPSYFGVWDSTRIEGVDIGKDTHPAAFPVGIAALIIGIYTNRGDRVFDPFMGTGTTLIAAHQEQRIAYGCEISPGYCDVICRRWQEYTGEKPQRVPADGSPESADFTGGTR